MQETDLHYPPESCPFCTIASAYPVPKPTSPNNVANGLWSKQKTAEEELRDAVPSEEECGVDRTSPSSFVVLRSRDVVAFLDILPMVGGHLLVATRNHKVKVADMEPGESREIGFFLPLLARTVATVTDVTDYNIVQNNGARAAQVVPHVHFHIIPRPASRPEIKSRSWTMFGRGQRDELDEDEGERMAREMRGVLRREIERVVEEGGKERGKRERERSRL